MPDPPTPNPLCHTGRVSSKATTRGRPADPTIDERILKAALSLYGQVGWAGFNLDATARRAGVSKTALYRRWPTKEELLLAALERVAEMPPPWLDLDDLPSCLTYAAEQVVDMFIGPKALVLPRVLVESVHYPRWLDEKVQQLVRACFAVVHQVLDAAIERGELPPDVTPELVSDLMIGSVVGRMIRTPGRDRPLTKAERDRQAQDIADHILTVLRRDSSHPVA